MKKIYALLVIICMMISANLAYSQVGINTGAPNPSSALDIVSPGNNTGLLIPRLTTAQRLAIPGPANSLLVYDNIQRSYWYWDIVSASWRELQYQNLWTRTAALQTYLVNTTDFVGIGTNNPGYQLHLYDNNVLLDNPPLFIEQIGNGDASASFFINTAALSNAYTIGYDQSHNYFKISNTNVLTGGGYGDLNTMMMISRPNSGITSINHQSRARAFMVGQPLGGPQSGQIIPFNVWYAISFDMILYDEQLEYVPGIVNNIIPPIVPNPTSGKFIAKEEGYYQVNARTEFITTMYEQPMPGGHVSIAIYVNGTAIAYGNKLNIFDVGGTKNADNDAPVVCDVVHLMPGSVVEIYVFQNFSNQWAWILGQDVGPMPPAPKLPPAVTYVSIHKIS
jgi:hypothetical protein